MMSQCLQDINVFQMDQIVNLRIQSMDKGAGSSTVCGMVKDNEFGTYSSGTLASDSFSDSGAFQANIQYLLITTPGEYCGYTLFICVNNFSLPISIAFLTISPNISNVLISM
jgi:hypothetical protein